MGRKLKAVGIHKESKPKEEYRVLVLKGHMEMNPVALRRNSSSSKKEEFPGIQQTMKKNLRNLSKRKLFSVRKD
jgi:hypothetical protein